MSSSDLNGDEKGTDNAGEDTESDTDGLEEMGVFRDSPEECELATMGE